MYTSSLSIHLSAPRDLVKCVCGALSASCSKLSVPGSQLHRNRDYLALHALVVAPAISFVSTHAMHVQGVILTGQCY